MKVIWYINEPSRVCEVLPNCKFMSYDHFAELNECTSGIITKYCESNDGCTFYDRSNNRFLVLYNSSIKIPGRIRWTQAHELGHIVCEHFEILKSCASSECSDCNSLYRDLEDEADYFASNFLAPFPMFKIKGVRSPEDIQFYFGLSHEASKYRYEKYLSWDEESGTEQWKSGIGKTVFC